MLIVVDKRVPEPAKRKLEEVCSQQSAAGSARLFELETEGLTYPAISGHPDIFFCPAPGGLIVSPGLPGKYFTILEEHKIVYHKGHPAPGTRYPASTPPPAPLQSGRGEVFVYPESVRFNAAVNERYLVHRLEFTDPVILERCHYLKKIAVKQGYTRCNLLLLKEDHFIASDAGICRALKAHGLSGICVSPEGIQLPGFPNGFIGGAMGLLGETVFVTGNLSFHPEGERIRKYLSGLHYSIVELYHGPLYDGGGILFL